LKSRPGVGKDTQTKSNGGDLGNAQRVTIDVRKKKKGITNELIF